MPELYQGTIISDLWRVVMKHTPGPWEYLESKGGAWFIYPPAEADGSAQPIRPKIRIPKRATKEMKANAYLIAAAPDMLTALEAVIARGCSCSSTEDPNWHAPGSFSGQVPPCPIPLVQAAIRKAKGE